MIWLLLLAAIPVGAALVCAFVPVAIEFTAPDGADLAGLRIRHPAFEVEIWVPHETALAWTLGERVLPPTIGQVLGIPFDRYTLRRLMVHGKSMRRKRLPPKNEVMEPVPERTESRLEQWRRYSGLAGGIWRRSGRWVRAAGQIEVLRADVVYGTGNPVTTGMVAGLLWQLAAVLHEPFEIRAEADWTAVILRGDGELKLLVFPWRCLVAAVSLALAGWEGWRHSRRNFPQKEPAPWPTTDPQRLDTVPSNRS